MDKAIVLAVAASFCTATASVAQRQGARSIQTTGRFDAGLIFRLARRPVWLLGIASIIGGFLFQLTALRFGTLAMVQPILALELLLVFGYMALAGRRQVKIKRRDWLAAAAMSAGIAGFLRLASPSGGQLHAPGFSWLLAGLVTLGVAFLALAAAFGLGNRPGSSSSRRAALLGSATGVAWGFVAAVIKELSSHLGGGIGAIFSTWSLYLLLAAGAATMLLASHALAAGPLAASQPGFTILDPLTAGLLGVFLFGEHIRTGPADLAGEALTLALVITGAAAISHSCFILGEVGDPSCLPAGSQAHAHRKQLPALTLGSQAAGASEQYAGNRQQPHPPAKAPGPDREFPGKPARQPISDGAPLAGSVLPGAASAAEHPAAGQPLPGAGVRPCCGEGTGLIGGLKDETRSNQTGPTLTGHARNRPPVPAGQADRDPTHVNIFLSPFDKPETWRVIQAGVPGL